VNRPESAAEIGHHGRLGPALGYAAIAFGSSKSDLRLELGAFEARMETRFANISAAFHRDMGRQTWVYVATTITALGLLGGLLH
jgi:hypothetical protein